MTENLNHTTKLINEIKGIISFSKETAIRKVDSERTLMYWKIYYQIFSRKITT